jgi:hypothetical protein
MVDFVFRQHHQHLEGKRYEGGYFCQRKGNVYEYLYFELILDESGLCRPSEEVQSAKQVFLLAALAQIDEVVCDISPAFEQFIGDSIGEESEFLHIALLQDAVQQGHALLDRVGLVDDCQVCV